MSANGQAAEARPRSPNRAAEARAGLMILPVIIRCPLIPLNGCGEEKRVKRRVPIIGDACWWERAHLASYT